MRAHTVFMAFQTAEAKKMGLVIHKDKTKYNQTTKEQKPIETTAHKYKPKEHNAYKIIHVFGRINK